MSVIDLHRYLVLLRKWAWLLVVSTGLAAFLSYQLVRSTPTMYVSSTTLMVGEATRNPRPGSGDLQLSQQLATTYAQMARRQPILEATVRALNLGVRWESLRERVLVVQQQGSVTFEIRAMDAEPRRALEIAAMIARQVIDASPTAQNQREMDERREFVRQELAVLQSKIQDGKAELQKKNEALARETSARGILERQDEIKALDLSLANWRSSYTALLTVVEGGGPNVLQVIEPATSAVATDSRQVWTVALAALAGLTLAVAGVLVIEYLDDTVKTRADLESLLSAPTLGLISQIPVLRRGKSPLLVVTEPDSLGAETYRVLAANLRFASLADTGKALLITSAAQAEGKSVTALNVSAALAQAGKSVLLVDFDLRNPSLHSLCGVSNQLGVTSLFLNPDLRPADCVLGTPLENLKLLPSGPIPPNPAELLGHLGEHWIERLKAMADFVIVDGPPVLAGADAVTLAAAVDGTLVVARAGRTRRPMCRAVCEALERAHARVIGGLLNAVPESEAGLYGYRYGQSRPSFLGRLWHSARKKAVTESAFSSSRPDDGA